MMMRNAPASRASARRTSSASLGAATIATASFPAWAISVSPTTRDRMPSGTKGSRRPSARDARAARSGGDDEGFHEGTLILDGRDADIAGDLDAGLIGAGTLGQSGRV